MNGEICIEVSLYMVLLDDIEDCWNHGEGEMLVLYPFLLRRVMENHNLP